MKPWRCPRVLPLLVSLDCWGAPREERNAPCVMVGPHKTHVYGEAVAS